MWRAPAGKLAADGLASGKGNGLWPGPASGPAPGAVPRALSTLRGSSAGDVTGSGSSSDLDLAGRGPGDTPLGHSIEKWAGVADDAGEAHVPGADIRDASPAQQLLDGGQAETPGGNGEQAIMASRAYQLEMLEQSLRQNVIVAMDTGSGKTQVAVLRIKAELERCDPKKIVWFITPTVHLSAQQHTVLKLQIPSVPMQMLAGNRHLPTWTQEMWTPLLAKTRVVITTPQILLDALDHAYLKMEHLALIVFDEVHNCVGKYPGGKIMQHHYHPCLSAGKSVPAILGLTATPSIQSEATDLVALEQLMDARCISPTLHRDELLKCVKRPSIQHKAYIPAEEYSTPTMKSLSRVYSDLDINKDPFVQSLRENLTERNGRLLEKTILKEDTYTQIQMKTFKSQSQSICKQLGPWAADLFIWKSISSYLDKAEYGDEFFDQWYQCRDREKKYLAGIFRRVEVEPPPKAPQGLNDISDKVLVLLEELLSIDEQSTMGIIFVEERVMVKMLAEILSINPAIKKKYRVGTMVGSSSYSSKRRVVYDFGDKGDLKALQNFRSGKINLLIATAVLEEGIDVPACNLVICFDVPKTSKSFIQRRGRARMKDSRLVLFFDEGDASSKKWEEKEDEMARLFEDEQREIQQLEMIEESESLGTICYTHPVTGARLDFDNAKPHLEHFCRTLSPTEFVDSRPDYIIHKEDGVGSNALTATVLLPPFIPVNPRQYNSASVWRSEKNATKDAAFQAYMALNDAGLLNDNLLPFKADEIPGIDSRVPEVAVEPMMKPWHHVAPAWRETGDKWLYSLTFYEENGQVIGEYEILLPVKLNQPPSLDLFLDRGHKLELRFSEGRSVPHGQVASLPDHTSALLALHFCHRWPKDELHNEGREHVVRIWAKSDSLSMDQIGAVGFDPFDEDVRSGRYLIRDNTNSPYTYKDIIECKPSITLVQNAFYGFEKAPEKGPYLVLKKWTRRTDFLHRLQGNPEKEQASSRPYSRVYPMEWAIVDTVPATHAMFGMIIPTIIHELGVMLMAKELATTVLEPVGISDWGLVREAICARSANEPMNYERLEFLGDSILKLCTCIQAAVTKPDWPEGYLSYWRDRLISNVRLYQAAVDFRLPRFLVTKPFTGHKWRPLYLEDVLQEDVNAPTTERRLSTKTLADVVEALIGASYCEGGIAMAEKCIAMFLSEIDWDGIDKGREILFNRVPPNERLPPILEPLERLLGYTFQRKALLTEALTHASFMADGVMDHGKRSLERMEFLGDAVLDHVIVTRIFEVRPELPHYTMHTLKTGLVNGDFLAFMTMEHGLKSMETVVTEEGSVENQETHTYLWQFMRHAANSIGIEQLATATRHAALRAEILDVMENGAHYPWALLAALNPKKFYSDLFEAVLGAVWVDSGSIEACRAVCAQFGLMKYLERLLRDKVHVQHPKEQLGKWANSETVVYDFHTEDVVESPGDKEFFCKVVIGERVVVEVRGGINKEEIKTKAATEALRILQEEKRRRDAEGDVVMGEGD
ncbi:hypothetical protein TRIATDRAFT_291296 [Trichoderma atroviride IMI 206040]|uniref:Dicer-like protein 2 n=1 Tax=Hypocrea atroviridis (strain ATCC 20476 / IMI 206040) TaxID=452589 RepID=G9NPS1_HYPAI|nr:uncharacterized protein TRIATDRAFT_291296 [Trichoderma atroviride IMI 206040]EHK47075.1 hypothetical protein TRIATDRAFT_291296 [Trichoderma atroviride IMI 206040]